MVNFVSPIGLDVAAIDHLMPMNLLVLPSGHIGRVGPTIAKLRKNEDLTGQQFLEVFELRRPRRNILNYSDLCTLSGANLRLRFRTSPTTSLKGTLLELPGEPGLLFNLSFGLSVVEAVQKYGLTNGDFSPTDLAIEMLYIVEAKTAVMEESQKLNLCLHRARLAAEEQASTDALTGLKNRRAMDQAFASRSRNKVDCRSTRNEKYSPGHTHPCVRRRRAHPGSVPGRCSQPFQSRAHALSTAEPSKRPLPGKSYPQAEPAPCRAV